jgi:ATP/maltotriose-dependent transcriptional regulator MalT
MSTGAASDRALGLAAAALAIRLAVLGPIHEDIERVLSNMSVWARIKGDLRASVALSERTLGIAEVVHGPEHPRTAWALSQLGASYYMVSRLEEMRAVTTRSLALFEKSYGPRSRQVAMTLINLGALDIDEERFAEAAEESGRSVAIFDELLGAESKPFNSLLNLATAQVGRGEVAAARAPLGRGLRHAEELKSPILLATALLTEIDVRRPRVGPTRRRQRRAAGSRCWRRRPRAVSGRDGSASRRAGAPHVRRAASVGGAAAGARGAALLEKDAPDSLAAADGSGRARRVPARRRRRVRGGIDAAPRAGHPRGEDPCPEAARPHPLRARPRDLRSPPRPSPPAPPGRDRPRCRRRPPRHRLWLR